TGGVVMSTTAYGKVVKGYAEPEVEEIVAAEVYDSVGDLVYGLGGLPGHVRPLTAEEIAAVQENMAARMLAQREAREKAARFEVEQAELYQQRRRFAGLLAQLVTLETGPSSH
ncbi:replication protein, partial [Streptomyces sp. NPDC058542]